MDLPAWLNPLERDDGATDRPRFPYGRDMSLVDPSSLHCMMIAVVVVVG
jgi:hypothetical protein